MFNKLIETITSFLKPNYNSVSAEEAYKLIKNRSHTLIDVRSVSEFSSGKIKGSKNIPLPSLASKIVELAQYQEKPILIICQSGMRSASACSQLSSKGFIDVTNLSGGIGAWQSAGKKLA